MPFQRLPRVPSKAGLTWRIARLRLDENGMVWSATAVKGGRVAVARLPPLLEPSTEDAWLATIESAFEASAQDPIGSNVPSLEQLARALRSERT